MKYDGRVHGLFAKVLEVCHAYWEKQWIATIFEGLSI